MSDGGNSAATAPLLALPVVSLTDSVETSDPVDYYKFVTTGVTVAAAGCLGRNDTIQTDHRSL